MHLCSSLARPWTHVHGDTLRRLAQLEFVESHPDECEETPWKCPSGTICLTQPTNYTCLNDTYVDCVGSSCTTYYLTAIKTSQ